MIVLYNNEVYNATITSLSENPYYLWDDALNDTRLTRYGRTLGDASEYIQFTYASTIDVDYVYISNTNITTGATVKIQANATDVWTSPSVDQALTYDSDNLYFIHSFATTQTYQYWRIVVEDSTNPDTFIQIAYVFLGSKLVMPGMNPDAIIPLLSNAQIEKSVSGHLFGDKRVILKGGRVVFPVVEESERKAIVKMFRQADLTDPVLILFWEDNLDVEPPLYSAITSNIEPAKNPHSGLNYNISFEFEEIK